MSENLKFFRVAYVDVNGSTIPFAAFQVVWRVWRFSFRPVPWSSTDMSSTGLATAPAPEPGSKVYRPGEQTATICIVCKKQSSKTVQSGGISVIVTHSMTECDACLKWVCDKEDTTCSKILEEGYQTKYKGQEKTHGAVRCAVCVAQLKLVRVSGSATPVEEDNFEDDFAHLDCDDVPDKEDETEGKEKEDASVAAAEQQKEEEERAKRQRKLDLSIVNGFNAHLLPTDAAGQPRENARQKLLCVSTSLREVKCSLVAAIWDALTVEPIHWTRENIENLMTLVPIFAQYLSRSFSILHNTFRNFTALVKAEGADWRDKCNLRSATFWKQFFTRGEPTLDDLLGRLREHVGSIVYATAQAQSGRVVRATTQTRTLPQHTIPFHFVYTLSLHCAHKHIYFVHNPRPIVCTILIPTVCTIHDQLCAQFHAHLCTLCHRAR